MMCDTDPQPVAVLFGAKDDPLLKNATKFAWFQAMLLLECFVQLPLSIISLIAAIKSTSTLSLSR